MKEKNIDQIARIEKAIKEKYGEEAIQNPKANWNKEKELIYLEQLKDFYKNAPRKRETVFSGDIEIKKRKTSYSVDRTCPVCGSYSFSSKDDLYMTKYECCFSCYVQYIEDREERWKSGWRPNN